MSIARRLALTAATVPSAVHFAALGVDVRALVPGLGRYTSRHTERIGSALFSSTIPSPSAAALAPGAWLCGLFLALLLRVSLAAA